MNFSVDSVMRVLSKPAGVLSHAFHRSASNWTVEWNKSSRTMVFSKTVFGNRWSFSWKPNDAERRVLQAHQGESAEQVVSGLRSFFGITYAQVSMLLIACKSVREGRPSDIPSQAIDTIENACALSLVSGIIEYTLSMVPNTDIGLVEALIGTELDPRVIPWFAPIVATEPEKAARALGIASKNKLTDESISWLISYGISVAGRSHISPRTASMYLGMMKNLNDNQDLKLNTLQDEVYEFILPMLCGDGQSKKQLISTILIRATNRPKRDFYGIRLACRGDQNLTEVLDKTFRFMTIFS